MANSKITELSEASSLEADDVLVVVDISTDTTKKVRVDSLKSSLNVTKADVGLSNVDNTSDSDKPISTATQVALDSKYDSSNPAGYITLAQVPEDSVTSVNSKVGNVVLDKSDIGLNNVDNTSDLDKPVSSATQLALDSKYDVSNPAGYITLAEVPADAVTSVAGKVGDVSLDKSDVGLNQVDNTSDANKPVSTATQTVLNQKVNKSGDFLSGQLTWQIFEESENGTQTFYTHLNGGAMVLGDYWNDPSITSNAVTITSSTIQIATNGEAYTPTGEADLVNKKYTDQTFEPKNSNIQSHISNLSNPHNVTKSQVGLSNVDNTSDANKPISTATQTALNAKQDTSEKNQPNGYVGLESDSKISSIYLPSYVDDVIEVADFASLPEPGETSKIYITLDNSKCYRYSGSVYVEISPSDVNSVNGKVGIVVLSKADIGLSNVDNTSDIDKPVSTAVQIELDGKISKAGDSVQGPLDWQLALSNGTDVQTYDSTIDSQKIQLETYRSSDGSTKIVNISAHSGIRLTTNGQPSLPIVDEEVTTKKYVDDALALKYDASNPAGYITLAQVPADSVTSVNTKVGDVVLTKSDIGLDQVDNTSDANKPISTATQLALDSKYDASNPAGYITLTEVPPDSVTSVNTKVGDVVLDKVDVGLDQVDNTSDANKPISTATQTALNGKSDTTHTHTDATVSASGFMSASDKTKLDKLSGKVFGPGQLCSFNGTLFQNSGYVPGITVNSTPSDYGYFPVQNLNFLINPNSIFGAGKTYRIRVIRRTSGAFNDGVHCMIRRVPENALEEGIPGLLDFGSGTSEYAEAVSDTLTTPSFSRNEWYRVYFAAYNGGNGATIQDVTIYIEEVL